MPLKRLPVCASIINERFNDYSLLDLGCRTMDLKKMLEGCRKYCGTDFESGEGIYECNLEEGLAQFQDNSFDIVTALDVLEHLENIHFTFHEAIRVAKKSAIISLPNMYYISFRWTFLKGTPLSGKYKLPISPVKDRHRWLLSYHESVNFIKNNVQDHKLEIFPLTPARGILKFIREPAQDFLAKIWPNIFAYGCIFVITKNDS